MIVPLLETKSLTIGYAAGKASPHVVAHDLNVALDEGELVCLLVRTAQASPRSCELLLACNHPWVVTLCSRVKMSLE